MENWISDAMDELGRDRVLGVLKSAGWGMEDIIFAPDEVLRLAINICRKEDAEHPPKETPHD